MRIVVYGVGAIGGVIGASLARAGTEVVGIARGGMLAAMQAQGGLVLVTAEGRELVPLRALGAPDQVDWRPDDTVLMCMKSNDTQAALEALAAAGVYRQAIVCAQNGVANERMALRHFENVYGITVMLPGQYTDPGRIAAFGTPRPGLFDIGRYPAGLDDTARSLGAALEEGGFGVTLRDDVMPTKYGKLLLNLFNIVAAAFGHDVRDSDIYKAARAEAEAALAAAGIDVADVGSLDPRRDEMQLGEVAGVTRAGSSSHQSLMRGTGAIETDWLNGEIVLLGRLHGVPTPVNAALCALGRRMAREGMAPGSASEAEFQRCVGL